MNCDQSHVYTAKSDYKEISIEAHWPLLIPPLLALVDDAAIHFKVKGCELLNIFLKITPSPLLERTGLGEVFHTALTPCLLYLPSLVSEKESIAILEATYVAFFTLNHVLYSGDKSRMQLMRALDKMMRDGIFRGYAHAGENVRIAKLLVDVMTSLINEMGIDTSKHLKVRKPPSNFICSADCGIKAYNTFAIANYVGPVRYSIPSPSRRIDTGHGGRDCQRLA